MPELTTAERMAIEVLRGDMAAARALADHLLNDLEGTVREVTPIKLKVTNPDARLQAIAYFNCSFSDVAIDLETTRQVVDNWLRDGGTLCVFGVSRVEVYELPPDSENPPGGHAI